MLSIAINTSFHNRFITITIEAFVRVCFIIAKFSSKYVKRGFSVFSTSIDNNAGAADCRFFHILVTDAIERLRDVSARRASCDKQACIYVDNWNELAVNCAKLFM